MVFYTGVKPVYVVLNQTQTQTQGMSEDPKITIKNIQTSLLQLCSLTSFSLSLSVFSFSPTWKITWRTRTGWRRSGRLCVPTRPNPTPAPSAWRTATPRRTASLLWWHVSDKLCRCSDRKSDQPGGSISAVALSGFDSRGDFHCHIL